MKVLHTIGSLRPEAGGPARSVQGLTAALSQLPGLTICLLAVAPGYYPWVPGISMCRLVEKKNWLGIYQTIQQTMKEFKPDLVHVHGIWSVTSCMTAFVAQRHGIPYIVAPRGMLEPWALNAKKWKKKIAMAGYQRKILKNARALHATAESERQQFQCLGFNQCCFVSPNGVLFPNVLPERRPHEEGVRRVLFLSRIHPKKGIVELLDAWSVILRDLKSKKFLPTNKWILEIAGTDSDGYLSVVKKQAARLGFNLNAEDQENCEIIFSGPQDEARKWEAYCRCDIFVLPSYSENFGIVVAEALYAGCPVVTTKATPWGELERIGCGKHIDLGVDSLVRALWEMFALSDADREEMGCKGRKFVEEYYAWPKIAVHLADVYRQLRTNYGTSEAEL